MFQFDAPVAEADLRRVTEHYKRTADGFIDLDCDAATRFVTTASVEPQDVNSKTDKDDEGSRLVQDLLCRVSTREEILKAYPPPPASLPIRRDKEEATKASEASGPAASKRARIEMTTPTVVSVDKAETKPSSAKRRQPVMHFAADFERVDYLGRSFLQPTPAALQQAAANVEKPCTVPRTLRGVFKSGQDKAAGIQQLCWAPPQHGHLLFSADLQGQVELWAAEQSRRQRIAVYEAQTQPIRSLQVTSEAATMSSGSADGTVVLWNVEAGKCSETITNAEQLPIGHHLHHPSNEHALLLVAADRKVLLYDLRQSSSKFVREYTGHMGTIFNITLLSNGTKMLTTAEDRTLRTWDYRIPVQIKQFADAGMHAITHVLPHPTEPFLAAQSLDNKVLVFQDDGGGRLRLLRHRHFVGHTISGMRCQLAMSHDGCYISSGDIAGKLFVWDWASGKLVRSFQAHTQMLVSHLWHPTDPSRVVTSSWDGSIRNWL